MKELSSPSFFDVEILTFASCEEFDRLIRMGGRKSNPLAPFGKANRAILSSRTEFNFLHQIKRKLFSLARYPQKIKLSLGPCEGNVEGIQFVDQALLPLSLIELCRGRNSLQQFSG